MLGRKTFTKQRSQMSAQKSDSLPKTTKTLCFGKQYTEQQKQPQSIVFNGGSVRYHFLAQQAVATSTGTADETLLWRQPVPLSTRFKKRIIVFKQLQYIISNWSGDKFPSVIYLGLDGFVGYKNKLDATTVKVAALELQQVQPMLDQAQLRTYDLRYVIKQSVNWEIQTSILELNLRIYIDNQTVALPLPLPNPISINCQIRYQ